MSRKLAFARRFRSRYLSSAAAVPVWRRPAGYASNHFEPGRQPPRAGRHPQTRGLGVAAPALAASASPADPPDCGPGGRGITAANRLLASPLCGLPRSATDTISRDQTSEFQGVGRQIDLLCKLLAQPTTARRQSKVSGCIFQTGKKQPFQVVSLTKPRGINFGLLAYPNWETPTLSMAAKSRTAHLYQRAHASPNDSR